MASPARVSAVKPCLNPFCLPSDTGCRFALLILMVLGSSLFIYNAMADRKADPNAFRSCVEPSATTIMSSFSGPLQVNDPSELIAKSDAFSRCVRQAQIRNAEWMLSGLALLCAASVIVLFLLPMVKIWRNRLVNLEADAPDVVSRLREMATESGLRKIPVFLWSPLNSAVTGLAFGHPGRRYIALTGGLVTKYHSDPQTFRAIVMHEFAHLKNADVDKTYLAVGSWYAFIALALLPFVLTMSRDLIPSMSWRLLVLALLVYLTRASVLRIRENYADVRASTVSGTFDALRTVICASPDKRPNFWERTWKVHPTAAQRIYALENTPSLFRVGMLETFTAGLACGIAIPSVKLLLGILYSDVLTLGAITTTLFATLIAGIVGTRIWRASLAYAAGQGGISGLWQVALALAAGLVAGFNLSFYNAIGDLSRPAAKAAILWWDLGATVFLIVILIIFVRWESISASVWLLSRACAKSPTTTFIVGRAISAAFLAIILGELMVAWETGQSYLASGLPGFSETVVGSLMIAPTSSLFTAVLLLLWAFPMGAWFWQKQSAAGPHRWLFLGDAAENAHITPAISLQPATALYAGLVGAAGFLTLHTLLHAVWAHSLPAGGASPTSKLAFYYSQVLLAAVLQTVVAAVVVRRVRALPLVHALSAAFVGGSIMALGFLIIGLFFGGHVGFKYVSDTFKIMINAGAIMAFGVGMIIAKFPQRRATPVALSAA